MIYKKSKNKKGFTLIETLVAIFVLVVGITFVLQLFPSALKIEMKDKKRTQAVELAEAKMEGLFSSSYNQLSVGKQENSLSSPYDEFTRVVNVVYVDSNLSTSTSDTGLKKIVVKVFWNNKDEEFSLTSLYSER